ncbi:nose resistant to fluoxetine protein 6-like [Chrysoperla carnea]|uniref:nose resistant to fluoxetine protein 6-like n=1 Tax=Chrysoperla carnea TaxID=189513 RepID=UPI001D071304|nr:nose resistant to fluoxetine protein 6-like [Chrysoperla carnea]XP_044728394.1 nose resistant to fluoxetine protein 6-like [Chrysoperla carnea]
MMNNQAEKHYINSLLATYITGGTLCVDTFLTISGCLLTYTFLKHIEKVKGKIPWGIFYLHRYIRLTVGLFVVLLLALTIFYKLGSGPLWHFVLDKFGFLGYCKNYWWSQLLYIQNYVNPNESCMIHTWYLSVDMQLYVLSPLILYPMWRWKKFAHTVIPILLLVLHISTFLIVYSKNLKLKYLSPIESTLEDVHNWNTYYYSPTHTRAITWLMGVLLGHFIYNLKTPKKLKRKFVIFMWIGSLILMLSMVLVVHPLTVDDYSKEIPWDPLYITFSRPLWSAGLCWVIFACYTGHGGPVNWFLSLNAWIPLSRISYSMYLTHLFVQVFKLGRSRTTKYFSPFDTFNEIFADTVLTIFFATCLYLLFECPIFNLEVWYYKFVGKKSQKKENADKNRNCIVENVLPLSIRQIK